MKRLRSILLVDDNETSNFLNERMLKRMQLTENIQVLNNGKDALDLLFDLSTAPQTAGVIKPELILLDVNMPVLDGFEFLEIYQELPESFRSDIIIAILSTSSHPKDTSRAEEFQVYYITKPLTSEKMDNLLSHYS